jgi:hypothetical protein
VSISIEQPYVATRGVSSSRAFWFGVLLLALADIIFLAAFFAGFFEIHHWFDEDGPIEDLQVVVLAVAFLVAAWSATSQSREGRIIGFGLTAMFLASCWREMELRGTGAPDWLIWMFYGTGQHIFIAAIFLVFIVTQMRRWRELPRLAIALLRPRTLLYLVAGLMLLSSVIAEISEKRFGNPAEVLEEWIELNGYVLFLLTVWFFPYLDLKRGAAAAWVGED